jgi:spore germination cell wall hydrolase CwlJ-like protein
MPLGAADEELREIDSTRKNAAVEDETRHSPRRRGGRRILIASAIISIALVAMLGIDRRKTIDSPQDALSLPVPSPFSTGTLVSTHDEANRGSAIDRPRLLLGMTPSGNEPTEKNETAKRNDESQVAARTVDALLRAGAPTIKEITVVSGESRREILCLALNIYHEARSDGKAAREAVGTVTINRLGDKRFPDSVCGVVDQPRQFSWTNFRNGGAKDPHPRKTKEWIEAQTVAVRVLNGETSDRVGKRKFFVERRVQHKVPWMRKGRNKVRVGAFVFADVDKERPRENVATQTRRRVAN